MLTPHLIHDVNGRRTTVYRRPEGFPTSSRADGVTAPAVAKSSFEIADYIAGAPVKLVSVSSQLDINDAMQGSEAGSNCVMFISDDAYIENEHLVIDCPDSVVFVQLEARAKAKLTVSSGTVVIKTFADHHTPEVTISGDAKATIIVAADTSVEVTACDDAEVTVVPEVGAAGTVNPQGSKKPVIQETGNLHRILVFAH
jgi:hypothetical protein